MHRENVFFLNGPFGLLMKIFMLSISPHCKDHKNHSHQLWLREEANLDLLHGQQSQVEVQGALLWLWEPRSKLGQGCSATGQPKSPANLFALAELCVL